MKFSKISVTTLVLATITLLGAQHQALANNQTIICSSNNNQHAYCQANTGNQVKLLRQLSSFPCQEGRTWGFDNNGIWVDKGCQAEFAIGNSFGGNNNNQNFGGTVPAWAVGKFQGKNLRDNSSATIAISPKGEVIAIWAGQTHTGFFDGYKMTLGNLEFAVQQRGDGFLTTLRTDHGNQVVFRRTN